MTEGLFRTLDLQMLGYAGKGVRGLYFDSYRGLEMQVNKTRSAWEEGWHLTTRIIFRLGYWPLANPMMEATTMAQSKSSPARAKYLRNPAYIMIGQAMTQSRLPAFPH